MKKCMSLLAFALSPAVCFPATDDPVVMTVAGNEIRMAEFMYFLEGNYDSSAGEPVSLMDYADMYADYKLKIKAATDAGIDTTTSFLSEYKEFRDIRAREFMIDSAYLEVVAKETYGRAVADIGPDGLAYMLELTISPADKTEAAFNAACALVDSAYAQLQNGVDFGTVVRTYSTDDYAANYGEVGFVSRGQLPQLPGNVLFSLKEGEYSKPFVFDGIPMIFLNGGYKDFGSFEDNKESIYQWMNSNDEVQAQAMQSKASLLADSLGWDFQDADSMVMYMDENLERIFPSFNNISREYHDGLLFFEISNSTIWDKAANDEQALQQYFDSNKGKIKFEKPQFRGMVFLCLDEQTFREIEAILKDLPYEQWSDTIMKFNTVDKIRVRAIRSDSEIGLIPQGQNKYVDKLVFGIGDELEMSSSFPYVNYIGKVVSAPERLEEARYLVSEQYQESLEKAWLKELHKKYKVKINKKAIKKISLN